MAMKSMMFLRDLHFGLHSGALPDAAPLRTRKHRLPTARIPPRLHCSRAPAGRKILTLKVARVRPARSSPDDAMIFGDAPSLPDPARGAPVRTLGSTECQSIADSWDWNADIAWFKNN